MTCRGALPVGRQDWVAMIAQSTCQENLNTGRFDPVFILFGQADSVGQQRPCALETLDRAGADL
jgi:hypothetical protein